MPVSVDAFVRRALGLETDSKFRDRRRGDSGEQGGIRWQALIIHSWNTRKVTAWRRQASVKALARAGATCGRWVLREPPVLDGCPGVTYDRVAWRIAVRLRLGLDPRLALAEWALPAGLLHECHNVYKTGSKAGEKCGHQHDAEGREALRCKVGGHVHGDHDLLRDLYVAAARPLYASLDTEKYLHQLARPRDDGSMQEARMDVISRSAHAGTTLIDFRLSIPPADMQNTLLKHEERKHSRYPLHNNGARVCNAMFIPGIVSALGGVGPSLEDHMRSLEAEGRELGRRAHGGMPLRDFLSCHAVYLCADRVRRVFATPRCAHSAFAADARRVGADGTEGRA